MHHVFCFGSRSIMTHGNEFPAKAMTHNNHFLENPMTHKKIKDAGTAVIV